MLQVAIMVEELNWSALNKILNDPIRPSILGVTGGKPKLWLYGNDDYSTYNKYWQASARYKKLSSSLIAARRQ